MKLKLLSSVLLGLTLPVSALAADTDEKKVVAKIISQENVVLADDAKGIRRMLKQGGNVYDQESLIILENSSVELQYVSSQCKVAHDANTLVTVTESSQCDSGQVIAVGQIPVGAGAGAGAGAAGVGAVGVGVGVAAGVAAIGVGGKEANTANDVDPEDNGSP